jgi:hypothetical protein
MSHQSIIDERLSCDMEGKYSFPNTFDFLERENLINAEYCVDFVEPFPSILELEARWPDDEVEEICQAPSTNTKEANEVQPSSNTSDISKNHQNNETYDSSSSPSSVTSNLLQHNPYLQIISMKEAFEGFKFLLPIMRIDIKKDIPKREPSRCDLQVAKQRLASIVLFHGGNLKQRPKSNAGSHEQKKKKKTKRNFSLLVPQLESKVNASTLTLKDIPSEARNMFKELTENSSNSSTTTEASAAVNRKVCETTSTEIMQDVGCVYQKSSKGRKLIKSLAKNDCKNDSASMGSSITENRIVNESPSQRILEDGEALPKSSNVYITLISNSEKKSFEVTEASITDSKSGCESARKVILQDGTLPPNKKMKTTYHCKLCGLPKQKHNCVHRQNLQRSIGTMVSIFY